MHLQLLSSWRNGKPQLPPAYFRADGDERKGECPSPRGDDYELRLFRPKHDTAEALA
jgi:hypothetical protein